jgi:hypothetical protein
MITERPIVPFEHLTPGTLVEFHTQSFFGCEPIAIGIVDIVLVESSYIIVNDGEIDFLIEPEDYIRDVDMS